MPIRIPDSLPARSTLEKENIFVITEHRALHQDIRPLKLLILNLMPTKIVTETQILRKLSNTPLQVEIQLLRTMSHDAKNVDAEHLESFYVSHSEIEERHYDGMPFGRKNGKPGPSSVSIKRSSSRPSLRWSRFLASSMRVRYSSSSSFFWKQVP